MRSSPAAGVELRGIDHDRMSVRVYGETAVVTERFTTKVVAGGRPVDSLFQHTDVFVKQDGGWRCVARHATRVADPGDPRAAGVKPARGEDGVVRASRPRPRA
jgi:hypothetical protein